MKLDLYHIDAFAERAFEGNPAVVCILDEWLPETIMQAIAAEMNQSETVFVVQRSDGDYRIRWFTPTIEIPLCGHATLATAHVMYEHLNLPREPIRFHSLSGPLVAFEEHGRLCLDFPCQDLTATESRHEIEEALGCMPVAVYEGEDLVVLLSDASEVAILEPDMSKVKQLPYRGVCVSAPGNGNGFDFVARFFAPASGIDEDPVTGSAYTKLVPLYAVRLGKTEFVARQVSKRGGTLHLSLRGDRVFISGTAVTVMHSEMTLPELSV